MEQPKESKETIGKEERRISVRNLVEFILRNGDMDSQSLGKTDVDAMQAGARLHRKIQSRGGSHYQAEVSLKLKMDIACAILVVEGRADGVISDVLPSKEIGDEVKVRMEKRQQQKFPVVTIDEIKCMYQNVYEVKQPDLLHLAQAKCYAYIYARQHELEEIYVQITYANLETEEIRRFWYAYSFVELEKWFVHIIFEYSRFVEWEIEHLKQFMDSAQKIQFPFPYRKGQKELASMVYSCIKREENLFVQAPTGVGKTISTIFPAIKAVGEKRAEKIFYLTAKTITRTVAQDSFALLQKQGLVIKTVTITAKEKMCILEECNCSPKHCERAKGHFDRVNACLYEIICNEDRITREVIEEYAKNYQVCPYELSLDVASFVDGIICDYNYLFDPKVRLRRFFTEQGRGEYIFLIDEAHNLVERGRDMYSAVIRKEEVLQVKKEIGNISRKLKNSLQRIHQTLLGYKNEVQESGKNDIVLKNCDDLAVQLLRFCTDYDSFREDVTESFSGEEVLLDFYFKAHHFLNMYEELDENYVIYVEEEGKKNFFIELFCVNPCHKISEMVEKGKSAIFFSATLLPVNYYKSLLTGNLDDPAIYIPSPFPAENRYLAIASGVTSKYTSRNRNMYETIVDYLRKGMQKKGNYMVFFSSYKMMEEVYDVAVERGLCEEAKLLLQKNHMSEEEREAFLEEFSEENKSERMLAFCILGGIFSEGIDLKESRLIGAFIVGNGLPMVCVKRELLKEHFKKQGLDGFAYAYTYPGMNKVLQAAGRVIRTEEDKGIILLMEERFQNYEYQSLFPKEWSDIRRVNQNNVEEELDKFWKQFP